VATLRSTALSRSGSSSGSSLGSSSGSSLGSSAAASAHCHVQPAGWHGPAQALGTVTCSQLVSVLVVSHEDIRFPALDAST